MVMHFRYRKEHIAQNVLELTSQKRIIGASTVLCFVDQDNTTSPAQWRQIRPLRFGSIVDAQQNGAEIHFYFAVSGYPQSLESVEKIREASKHVSKRGTGRFYAALGDTLGNELVSSEKADSDAFALIVDQFQKGEFVAHQSDPLFIRVEGLFSRSGSKLKRMEPTELAGVSNRRRGFLVKHGDPLELRAQFHQPNWSDADKKGLTLGLSVDGSRFSVPGDDPLEITSPYDEAEFYMLPVRDNKGWLSQIGLKVGSSTAAVHNDNAFTALVFAKPRVPTLFSRLVSSLAPTVSIFVAWLSIVSAFFTHETSKPAANTANWFSAFPAFIWVAWVILIAIVALDALIKDG
jgi:hypothetical protein